jgi:hypothetical protein
MAENVRCIASGAQIVQGDVEPPPLGPVSDGGNKILFAIANDELRSQLGGEGRLCLRAHGGRNPCTGQTGELDPDMACSAGAGMNEHLLARSDARPLVERLPEGNGDQRQSGGVDEIDMRGLGHKPARGDDGEFGVGAGIAADAAVAEADRIAGLEASDLCADRFDLAGPVVTGYEGPFGLNIGSEAPEIGIGRIDPGRLQPNQDIAGPPGPMQRYRSKLQDVRLTEAGRDDCPHHGNCPKPRDREFPIDGRDGRPRP